MDPKLYIVARTDIAQMNPGKLAAQCCHAQSAVAEKMSGWASTDQYREIRLHYRDWIRQGDSFGTTIVLEASLSLIRSFFDEEEGICFIYPKYYPAAGLVFDPEYPFSNHYGEVCFSRELTCAYFFACDETPENVLEALARLPLHR